MRHSILATIVLALITAPLAAADDDFETQLKALQKERLETLTELVEMYTRQYEAGYVSGEVFVDAQTALVNAQLDPALVDVQLVPNSKLPDEIGDIVGNASMRAGNMSMTAIKKYPGIFPETGTDLLLGHLPSSHWHLRLAREEKDEAEIKDDQQDLIEVWTKLCENYKKRYATGTAPLESLIKAQAAQLDARMDAAEKPDQRAALLEEHAKNEAELFKVAENKQKIAACLARSRFLNAKVNLLRERGEKDDAAAQIKAAQKERIEALTELVKIETELEKTKWTKLATLTQAKYDLANAQADAAGTSEEKIQILTKAINQQTEVVRITKIRAGLVATQADVDRERLHLLDYQIRLLRERNPQKPQDQ
jgi:glycerol-3-phosphate cytidylyltransferase-like family protein